jgi:hypothetical protein
MTNKVYCKDCCHCDSIFPVCHIKEISTVVFVDSAYEPGHISRKYRRPLISDKNKNNDCKDFKKNFYVTVTEKIKSWVK